MYGLYTTLPAWNDGVECKIDPKGRHLLQAVKAMLMLMKEDVYTEIKRLASPLTECTSAEEINHMMTGTC
ncbi:hypothetical protein SAY87_003142 [Trapa incisa]|uniref:Uncharacterized protein n=1 Tax=Trapa incisa TaxID=236973 RepID=A0AAN7QH96_9MYRT|nr:hypothetical protein SAY87_003142 [Trapa incisa]